MKQFTRNNLGYLLLLAALMILPFALTLFTGAPLNKGLPLFVQGLMIQVFILAVVCLELRYSDGAHGHPIVRSRAVLLAPARMRSASSSSMNTGPLPAAIAAVSIIAAIESFVIGVLSCACTAFILRWSHWRLRLLPLSSSKRPISNNGQARKMACTAFPCPMPSILRCIAPSFIFSRLPLPLASLCL